MSTLPRRAVLAAAVLAPSFALSARAEPARELTLGIVPNMSARAILVNYQPFREYLAAYLAQPVAIATAPNFVDHHRRTMDDSYDIVVTAANLGRVAQLDGGHRLVAVYEPGIPGLFVASKDRPVATLDALRGRAVAMANPQSLVAMRAVQWLEARGLRRDVDYRVVHTRNEESLAQLLATGDAPLAVMSAGELRALSEDVRAGLHVHEEFVRVPGFFVLVSPCVDDKVAGRIARAVLEFPATEAGKRFAELTGVRAIREPRASDFAEVDPVIDGTRLALAPR